MWENANTILSCSILDRNYYSPRTGQSSQTLTKITKHIKTSLRTISIKFLLVIITLYKQRMGDSRYRTQSLRLRRLRFTARTGIIIEHGASFQTSPNNKRHAHHETHLHTMKVVTIVIPSFHVLRYGRLGPWPTIWGETHERKRLHF